MKNLNILNLKRPVPKRIRLNVYKRALAVLKGEGSDRENRVLGTGDTCGLCLLLPMLLWDFDDAYDNAPDGEDWHINDVPTAFPEAAEGIERLIALPWDERKELRIKILEDIIANWK